MKIRALRLEHFKKFDRPVTIEGFGDGLNLIAGPNETGKSTLLLALRAALFERHGSKAQAVKDLVPYHVSGAAPRVELAFEIGNKTYQLTKTFLKKAMARLEAPGGQRFEGAEAEAELKRLLGLDPSEKTSTDKDSPAHFGVLLTPQTRSFHQPALASTTRHSMEAVIASEIAELGSQSEVEGVLATLRDEQGRLVDGRGKPKGHYKDVETRLVEVEAEIGDLEQKRGLLKEDVAALNQAIAKRDELAVRGDDETLAERLAALEAGRAEATRRQALENSCLAARQKLQQLQTAASELRRQHEERRRLRSEAAEIDGQAIEVKERLNLALKDLAASEASLAELGEKRERRLRRKQDLEALGRQIERRREIDGTLKALATEVRFDLEGDALDRVTVNDEALSETRGTLQVTEGLAIEIEGVGRLSIEPKIEPMRDALSARDRVSASITDLEARLELDDVEPEGIEELWQTVAAALETVESDHASMQENLSDSRRQATEAKATLAGLTERRQRLETSLMRPDVAEDEDLTERLTTLDREIGDAEAALEDAERERDAVTASGEREAVSNLPPERLEAELQRLRAEIDERRQANETAAQQVVRLESAINVRAGLGLDEQLDQLQRHKHLLEKERSALARDKDALVLAQSTLAAAAERAKATFNAPLSARLAPYIQDLFPGATPVVTPDFSIRAIDRNGVEEPFLHLSDGTREQIAILARLAFADMLREQGLPALIVLDDALAFSDDRRHRRMVAILEDAAKRMQIVVLSCRDDPFAGIEAKRLEITPAAEPTSSAA